MAEDFTYEITKHLANLKTNSSGWIRELNLVIWGQNKEKYDIRDWNEDHTRCGKGITFDKEEMQLLYRALKDEIVEVYGGDL